jgi:CRISPR-associated protein Cmr2
MSDAVLIFTFSPVQSFIAEARRASDLYVGSQILVCLAKAAGSIMEQRGTLIYPAALGDDVPNKLVACVAWDEVESVAEDAKKALHDEWNRIAETARWKLTTGWEIPTKGPLPEAIWHTIWARQVSNMWEIHWAAASLENRSYKEAYKEASNALEATKHTRMFEATEEHGVKDTLSGCREALHTMTLSAKDYWAEIGKKVTVAKLQAGGRERLDAIGAIKRFSEIADESRFPSTSTIASRPFLNVARQRRELVEYRQAMEELLKGYLYKPNRDDPDWPYDGDLLFMETLTTQRLESSYGLTAPDQGWLQMARDTLREVYNQVKPRPSPYYAVIVLDGDGIGQRINACLTQPDPQQAHEQFSRRLAKFSDQVKEILSSFSGSVVYNGGDDVLALALLSTSFDLTQTLARTFAEATQGTASAGIAIAHHLYPLGAVLQAARQAEKQAKQIEGKNAVSVCVLKRNGETLEIRSPWTAVGDTFADVVQLFQGDTQGEPLSSKFAYDVPHAAYALPEADEKSRAELRRLLTRHRNTRHPQAPDPDEWAKRLHSWATQLAGPDKFAELGRWLVFARFMAQGGGE